MSTRQYITEAENLPKWSAPISHAVVVGKTCYVSGQLSVDQTGQFVAGTIYEEAERSFTNFVTALEAAGFSADDVVYVDLAFINLDDASEVNAVFAKIFSEDRRPARTIYQAAALPFGGKIKVQGVAIKD